MKKSVFIFRRDLRIDDNTALIHALKQSKEVLPIFVFDPRQIGEGNEYKGQAAMQFLRESLEDLEKQMEARGAKLYFFYGKVEEVLAELFTFFSIDGVFVNRDYTPFSLKRDAKIEAICTKHSLEFHSYHDAILLPPEFITRERKPYTIYTFFARKAREFPVQLPEQNHHQNYFTGDIISQVNPQEIYKKVFGELRFLAQKGGREIGFQALGKMDEFKNFQEERNFPALHKTTLLSAHNKFGTISIREFYYAVVGRFGVNHTLINELYWRDFFTHIAFHFPKVFGHAFNDKYNEISWENNLQKFKAWCEGKTGFPIVDAGMRELNESGFMHNRVRMIVASFLMKDLHIDWRWGEKYFAQKLVDYDPAVNNGNWQWAASTGCDAQPYFRIFNPWLQQKRFDSEAEYIKKWVPELQELSSKEIHDLEKKRPLLLQNYPLPIVHHSEVSKFAKEMYAHIGKLQP